MSEDAKSFVDSIFKNAGTPTTPSKKWLKAGGVASIFLILTAALAYYLFLNPNSPISTILPIKQTEETTSPSFPATAVKTDPPEESKAELKIGQSNKQALSTTAAPAVNKLRPSITKIKPKAVTIIPQVTPSQNSTEAPVQVLKSQASLTIPYNTLKYGPILSDAKDEELEFSHDKNFSNIYLSGVTDKNGYFQLPLPPSGKIYWRKKSSTFKNNNKVMSIAILPPKPLQIQWLERKLGNSIIQWKVIGKRGAVVVHVAKDESMFDIEKVIVTSDNRLNLRDLPSGRHYIRLQVLNLVSGEYEFSQPLTFDN